MPLRRKLLLSRLSQQQAICKPCHANLSNTKIGETVLRKKTTLAYRGQLLKSWYFQSPPFVIREMEVKLVHLVHSHDVQKFQNFLLGMKITSNVHHQPAIRKTRGIFDGHLWNQALVVHEREESLDTIEHPSISRPCDFDELFRGIHLKLVRLTRWLLLFIFWHC